MSDDIADALLKRWADLKTERAQHEPAWRDAAFYVRANAAPDRDYGPRPYDGEAIRSAHRLAAGLIGAVMNPGAEWFALTTRDADLDAEEEIAAWIEHVTDEVSAAFRDPAAGWAPSIHEMALDLVSYGTGIVSVDEHPDRAGLATMCWPVWRCWLACDVAGQVDTVFREHEISARSVAARWPDADVPSVQKHLDSGKPDALVKLLYAVMPWDDAGKLPGAKKRFAYVIIAQDDKTLLSSEGRDELPVFAARWATNGGDVYGLSPVHIAMPDVKTQNAVVKAWITGAELKNRPPMLADEATFVSAISLNPGAINMVDMAGMAGEPLVPLELGVDLGATTMMREALRKDIAATLLTDLWSLPSLHNMSATEIMRRMQLHAQVLGPIIGRMTTDLLGPVIVRAFGILRRQGRLRPPPEALGDRPLTVTYLSPLAQEARLAEAQGVLQLLQLLPAIASADQSVVRAIDFRQAMTVVMRGLGVPLTILKPRAQYEQETAEAQAAQQSAQAQQEGLSAATMAQRGAAAIAQLMPGAAAP